MTTKARSKTTDNGTAPPVGTPPNSPDLTLEELNLIHAMLSQTTFAESQAKITAGQLQLKIERFVGQ